MRFPLRARVARKFTIAALCLLACAGVARAATSYKQPGFSESVVFTGLVNPTVVKFLPDGRVVVAEKSGLIKLFPNISTNTFTVVADLRTKTHNFWDRGLLGLAIDPNFATNKYVYVLYAFDAAIGSTAPRWGTPGATSDPCPSPPGATTDGCVISGHLSRLTAVGSDWTASEQVLIEDWCQQFPSHSIGSLSFGLDGYLYVTGGDGASFNNQDWGQFGGSAGSPIPKNPCGDPPAGIGGSEVKPTAEGGALRSQSSRRAAGEPRLLNGSVLRVDPATGAAAPGNPLGGSSDLNEQRIIGYGLRNPFRMLVKPGTNEVYIADVGWNTWEEINRIPDITTARNFGWPCFEGNAAQYTGLNICPTQAQTTPPLFTYNHSASVVAGDGCTTGSSSVAGMAFYGGASNYPVSYTDALFFSDYSRNCMWVMFPDGNGVPDPSAIVAFASAAQGPVNLEVGPDGNVWYTDFDGGKIWRVKYGLDAVAVATSATSGTAPLTVSFSGSGSVPALPGDTLTYAWDLNGDGLYDDSAAVAPSFAYTVPGTYTVRLQVTDQRGGSDLSAPITVSAGNTAPVATIDTPLPTLTWKVGDPISFTGHATDAQDGTLAPASLSWQVIIHHCPSNCHTHVYQTFPGVDNGSFPAPDHEYPSYLEIQLTATDAQGLTNSASVTIQPQTVDLSFQTSPTGLQLAVGTFTGAAPFVRTVIKGSLNNVDALAPQGSFPNVWDFSSWSDSGAVTHGVTANASGSYTSTYVTHADLGIAVSAAPEPVGAGTTLTYTLTVTNAGPSQASSLSVIDTLPSGVTFVSAGGAGWSCSGTTTVTCTIASLGLASAAPISIAVTAPAEAGSLSNSATVSAATADPASGNNTAITPSTVFARSDLSIGQSGAPAQICTSQPISYTLSVSNAGPSTATSVSVSDAIPSGASLVSASGTGWSCSGTTTVTCTRASLAVGAAPAITVTIDAPATAGSAVNSASVSSAVNDPSAANNSSTATTTVNAVPSAPTAGNGGAVCSGSTLQLTASSVAGGSYAWTGPNGFTSSAQNPTIPGATVAASGLYSVTVSVSGCVSPAGTTTATVRPLPTATVSGGATVCAGGSAALVQAALTGTGPWSVVWSDGVTQSNVVSSPATRSVSPALTTTYTVTSVSDASCAGTSSGSALVTVNPRPTAVAGGTAQICAGAGTPVSGSGGVSCAWAPATGLSNAASCSPVASPAATTTYTLTVTDANGCVSNNGPSVTVTVAPLPTAAVSGTAAICAGSATTIQAALTGTGPWTVVWSDGVTQSAVAASPASRSVSPAGSTTYTVTSVSDANCSGNASGSAAVTVNPKPTATASGAAEICAGASTTIQAVLTGTAPWSVTWSDGVTQSGVAASPATRSVSPAASTTYTVTAVSDAHCSGSSAGSAAVTVDPKPAAAVSGGGAICAGSPVIVSAALTGTAPWTVTWSDGVTQSGVAASPATRTVSPASSTTYTVTALSDAHCTGTSSGSAPVTVNPKPAALVSGTAQICAGGATIVQAALTGSAPWTVVWSDGVTQSGVAASPATRSVSPAATTTYTVTAVSDANCAGAASGSAAVTVNPRPNAAASGSAEICAGASTPLSGSGGVSCAWAPAAGLSNTASCSPAASPAATTTYTLTVTDANGCLSNNPATVTVTVDPKPTAAVSGSAAICPGGATIIQAALTGSAPWTVTWSDGTTQSGVAASPATRSVAPGSTTTYTVTAVSDAHCAGTASGSAAVTVNPRPTAAAGGSAEICAGTSTPLSGSGGVSCAWAPAAGLSNPASCSPLAAPAATTTYALTVTDANGCTSVNAPSVTVTVDPRPAAAVSGGGEICVGGAVQIQATLTGTPPWSVTWSDGATQSGIGASPAARSVSPASSATYTVTAVSDAHCAGTASGSAPVTVHARPTAIASGTAAICPGGATPLAGSGGATCAWAPATGLSDATSCSPSAAPAATTTYNLTVTDANGCVSNNAAAATVTVNPIPPPPSASNDGPVCAGGTLHLSASTVAGGVYAWTGPNGFTSSLQNPSVPGVPLAGAGLYSVTVSVNGCASLAATTPAAVRALPTAVVSGDAVICQGSSAQIAAVLTGTGPWSVTWSDGLVQSVGATPAARSVTPDATTTYTVVSVADAHCMGAGAGQAEITVGLPVPAPDVTAPLNAAIGALGLAATVEAHDGSTFAWTVVGGSLASGQGSAAITFDAGDPGTTMLVQVTETNTACVSPAAAARVQVDFLDVAPDHIFHDYVNTIARDGVTAGCGAGDYCPDNANTRAQMAVFLLKSKYGGAHVPPPATGTVFLDVPATDPFAPWIEELSGLGVTGGCGAGKYCPAAPVTRAQMSVFLLKTLLGSDYAPPPASGTVFGDVPGSAFAAAWIEDLFARGVTGGCQSSPPLYCPNNAVTRGQMAVFLVKTFGLQ